jgi:hypothetical protein
MRPLSIVLFIAAMTAAMTSAPAALQQRTAPKKPPTFPEAIELAKQAADGEQFGTAISALQAGIRDLQKKQRVVVLAGMPKPEGWEVQDEEVDEVAEEFGGATAVVGMTVRRQYRKGDGKSLSVEVTANSPMLQMVAVMFSNPALITADGGELVQYGAHKAILKKTGGEDQELQILMHDKHLIRVNAQGVSADDLLKVFDQAFVDRMEKPLGK